MKKLFNIHQNIEVRYEIRYLDIPFGFDDLVLFLESVFPDHVEERFGRITVITPDGLNFWVSVFRTSTDCIFVTTNHSGSVGLAQLATNEINRIANGGRGWSVRYYAPTWELKEEMNRLMRLLGYTVHSTPYSENLEISW